MQMGIICSHFAMVKQTPHVSSNFRATRNVDPVEIVDFPIKNGDFP